MVSQRKPPVFVVGSPRSGTTLLYHMLLSSGGFAVFRAETHAFDVLSPKFGNLRRPAQRRRCIDAWMNTRQFGLSKVDPHAFTRRVLNECRTTGDFLRVFMEMIADAQQVSRWAECTPDHLTHLPQIKREIPDALILHVIRDGRAVAQSRAQLGWVRRLPLDKTDPVVLSGLAWRWAVARARRDGAQLGRDYLEIRFESLVQDPQMTLTTIGAFIGEELDYDRIRSVGIGSVSEPNTSFRGDQEQRFDPVERFRRMAPAQLAELEFVIGDLLASLNYERLADPETAASVRLELVRAAYEGFLSAKQWARSRTPLGRRISLDSLNIW